MLSERKGRERTHQISRDAMICKEAESSPVRPSGRRVLLSQCKIPLSCSGFPIDVTRTSAILVLIFETMWLQNFQFCFLHDVAPLVWLSLRTGCSKFMRNWLHDPWFSFCLQCPDGLVDVDCFNVALYIVSFFHHLSRIWVQVLGRAARLLLFLFPSQNR